MGCSSASTREDVRDDSLDLGPIDLRLERTLDSRHSAANIVELRADVVELRVNIVELRANIVEPRANIVDVRADVVELRAEVVDVAAVLQHRGLQKSELAFDAVEPAFDGVETAAELATHTLERLAEDLELGAQVLEHDGERGSGRTSLSHGHFDFLAPLFDRGKTRGVARTRVVFHRREHGWCQSGVGGMSGDARGAGGIGRWRGWQGRGAT